jgi:hypothetical protein
MPIFRFAFATEKESVHIEPVEGIRAYTTFTAESEGVWVCDRYCATYEMATTLAEQMGLALFTGLKSARQAPKPQRPSATLDLGKVLWDANLEVLSETKPSNPIARLLPLDIMSWESLHPNSQASQRKIAAKVVAAAVGS